jgi:hypothetical protein
MARPRRVLIGAVSVVAVGAAAVGGWAPAPYAGGPCPVRRYPYVPAGCAPGRLVRMIERRHSSLAETLRSPDGTEDRGTPSRRTVGARACAPEGVLARGAPGAGSAHARERGHVDLQRRSRTAVRRGGSPAAVGRRFECDGRTHHRARAAPDSSEDAGAGDGHAGVRRRCRRRGARPRRHAEHDLRRCAGPTDSGGKGPPTPSARSRRWRPGADKPVDRDAHVRVPPHGGLPPAQGVRQAGGQLACHARGGRHEPDTECSAVGTARIRLSGCVTPRVPDGRAASGCSARAFDTPCSGGTRRCAG